ISSLREMTASTGGEPSSSRGTAVVEPATRVSGIVYGGCPTNAPVRETPPPGGWGGGAVELGQAAGKRGEGGGGARKMTAHIPQISSFVDRNRGPPSGDRTSAVILRCPRTPSARGGAAFVNACARIPRVVHRPGSKFTRSSLRVVQDGERRQTRGKSCP